MSENFLICKKIVWNAIKDCTKDTMTTYEYESIDSPTVEILIEGKVTEWCLGLYPHDPSHISLILFRADDLKIKFNLKFTVYVIGKSGRHHEISFRYTSDNFGDIGQGADPFLSHTKFTESFDELVVDGIFKVGCEITISSWNSKPSTSSPLPAILKNIQKMYDEELFTDFELRCSDRKALKCHKAILATQSPVFRAMLSNDMKETQEVFVEVPDFDSTVMSEVLRFIYGFTAENLENIADKLIFAAEKYDLDDLKQKCIENITEKLSTENVVQALLISDKVSGSEKLFEECMAIVVGSLSEISKTTAWSGLSNGILMKIINATAHTISSFTYID